MHNFLHIWRANYDIQLSLSPHALIEYILSHVIKGQIGMSIMMECACEDANIEIWNKKNLFSIWVMYF